MSTREVKDCLSFFIHPNTQVPTKKAAVFTITLIALGAIGIFIATLALLVVSNKLPKLPAGLSFFSSLGAMGYYGSAAFATFNGVLFITGVTMAIAFGIKTGLQKRIKIPETDANPDPNPQTIFSQDQFFDMKNPAKILGKDEYTFVKIAETIFIFFPVGRPDGILHKNLDSEDAFNFYVSQHKSLGFRYVSWDHLKVKLDQKLKALSTIFDRLLPGEVLFSNAIHSFIIRHFSKTSIADSLLAEGIYFKLCEDKNVFNEEKIFKEKGYQIQSLEKIINRKKEFKPKKEPSLDTLPICFDCSELLPLLGFNEFLIVEGENSKLFFVTKDQFKEISNNEFNDCVKEAQKKNLQLAHVEKIHKELREKIVKKMDEMSTSLKVHQAYFYISGYIYRVEDSQDPATKITDFIFTRDQKTKNEIRQDLISKNFTIIFSLKEKADISEPKVDTSIRIDTIFSADDSFDLQNPLKVLKDNEYTLIKINGNIYFFVMDDELTNGDFYLRAQDSHVKSIMDYLSKSKRYVPWKQLEEMLNQALKRLDLITQRLSPGEIFYSQEIRSFVLRQFTKTSIIEFLQSEQLDFEFCKKENFDERQKNFKKEGYQVVSIEEVEKRQGMFIPKKELSMEKLAICLDLEALKSVLESSQFFPVVDRDSKIWIVSPTDSKQIQLEDIKSSIEDMKKHSQLADLATISKKLQDKILQKKDEIKNHLRVDQALFYIGGFFFKERTLELKVVNGVSVFCSKDEVLFKFTRDQIALNICKKYLQYVKKISDANIVFSVNEILNQVKEIDSEQIFPQLQDLPKEPNAIDLAALLTKNQFTLVCDSHSDADQLAVKIIVFFPDQNNAMHLTVNSEHEYVEKVCLLMEGGMVYVDCNTYNKEEF